MTVNEPEDPKMLARRRAILDVLAERMSATQAALELGVSRKTFYEWQVRVLAAIREALRDRPGGRPLKPVDPEKERLAAELADARKDRIVLEARLRIQHAIRETLGEMRQGTSPRKKKRAV